MIGFVSIRKSGFRLFSIRRSNDVDAPSKVGELEMLVMKYVRKTEERGRTESAGTVVLPASGAAAIAPDGMGEDDADSEAGFSFGEELCMLRLPVCLPRP